MATGVVFPCRSVCTKTVDTGWAGVPCATRDRLSRLKSIAGASTTFASCQRRDPPRYIAVDVELCAVIDCAVTWIGLEEANRAPLGWGTKLLYVLLTSPSAKAVPVVRSSRIVWAVVVMPPSLTRGEPVKTNIWSAVVYKPRSPQALRSPSL